MRSLPSNLKSLVSGSLAILIASLIACSNLLSPSILLLTKPIVAVSAGDNSEATISNNSAASRKSAASAIISHDSIAISSFHCDKVTWSTGPSERHLDTNLPGVLGTSISDILLTLPWKFRYIGDK